MTRAGNEVDRRIATVFLGAVLPLLLASALVAVRGTLQNANVALILVVVVVFIAAVGARPAGAVAALSSAISFNFFHTKPYLRLTIDSADDIETTVLLLVVGLLVGHLAAGRRQARNFARDEIRRIHRMGGFTARGEETPVVILAAEQELVDLLGLTSCRFEAPPSPPVLPRIERSGVLDVRTHRFRPEGFELPADGVELPVYGRGTLVGRFVLEPMSGVGVSLERRVLAVAIADQVGAALTAGPPRRKRRGDLSGRAPATNRAGCPARSGDSAVGSGRARVCGNVGHVHPKFVSSPYPGPQTPCSSWRWGTACQSGGRAPRANGGRSPGRPPRRAGRATR